MKIKKIVADAFHKSTEELMNGETAVNMDVIYIKTQTKVVFDIDRGRGGVDSYSKSFVTFKNGKVCCVLGESLEGCGIEEMVEETLQSVAYKVTPPLKKTLGKVTPEIILSTEDFIKFVEKNSDMNWDDVCDFVNKEKYIIEECEQGMGQNFGSSKPNLKRVKSHGYDYEYEFLKAHPQLDGYSVRIIFED